MLAPALPAPASRLLDSFPLIRSRSADEARQRVGDVFSPHRLELRGDSRGLDVRHNRVALGQSAINVLHYGADAEVVEPKALREQLRAHLQLALSNYEDG